MQGYYQQPIGGMMPGMGGMGGMQGMGMMPGGGGMGGMMPGQGMGMMPGGGMMGQNGQMGMMGQPGQFWRQGMPQDYQLPSLGYSPDSSWGAWELANARYSGDRMQRGFFDQILNGLSEFFGSRHLSQQAARDAHYRVYYSGEGTDSGNKTLGGAAAYQAFLFWDKEHHSLYHSYPSSENRERLVGLAVAELFSLWDRVQPRSSRATPQTAAEFAAATAKHLYDRHYDISSSYGHGHGHHSRHSGYGADDDSEDDESEGRRMRRRSGFRGGYGPMGMSQGTMPPPGMGMPNPGMGGFGMPGAMVNGMPGQMGQLGPMGPMGMSMGMQNPMMSQMGMMPGMGMGMSPSMLPGGYGNPMNESQAGPGMHPYTYGAQSGVAYGNQPIDQMGMPTFPGGPGRAYGYGQQRYY